MANSGKKGGGQGRPNHTDAVGYCRPPVEHRFRSGEPSRNPFGRGGKPRKQEELAESAPDFLDELVTISVDGKPTRMTRDEALDHSLFMRALKGSDRAARELDRRRTERTRLRVAAKKDDKTSLDEAGTDAEIIARALARQSGGFRGTHAGQGPMLDTGAFDTTQNVARDGEAEHG